MKRVLVVMLLLVACHRETKLDTAFVEQVLKDETNNHNSHELVQKAAVDTDTKTERENDSAVVVEEPDGTVLIAKVPAKKPLVLPKGSKVTGTLDLGGGVKTEQTKKAGPVSMEKDDQDKTVKHSADNKKLDTHLDDVRDTGPGFKFYLFLILGFVILLTAGYAYLKMVKKVSWL